MKEAGTKSPYQCRTQPVEVDWVVAFARCRIRCRKSPVTPRDQRSTVQRSLVFSLLARKDVTVRMDKVDVVTMLPLAGI
jgi:hypothetical protein